jgi:hypothetical protein
MGMPQKLTEPGGTRRSAKSEASRWGKQREGVRVVRRMRERETREEESCIFWFGVWLVVVRRYCLVGEVVLIILDVVNDCR